MPLRKIAEVQTSSLKSILWYQVLGDQLTVFTVGLNPPPRELTQIYGL